MGSADIIPGVSGGTMALITGIYDRLINAVRSVDRRVIKSLLSINFRDLLNALHWRFLLILVSGILLAVFFFTRIVPLQIYMHTNPELIYGLFFGLIFGSIFILLKEVDKEKRTFGTLLPLLIGSAFGFWIVTLVPTETPESFIYLFVSGMFAFSAMLLPGISGSYILLILGKYDFVLSNLAQLGNEGTVEAAFAITPLFLGGIAGLVLFSRILSWLLRHFHTVTLMLLIGFLVGSLYAIWPYQERDFREVVTHSEWLDRSDPIVEELIESPPAVNHPSFIRIAEKLGPEGDRRADQQVKIEHVDRILVHSKPFIPGYYDEAEPNDFELYEGIFGIIAGLILVAGLDYIRYKK